MRYSRDRISLYPETRPRIRSKQKVLLFDREEEDQPIDFVDSSLKPSFVDREKRG